MNLFKHVLILFGAHYNHQFHRGIAGFARTARWHLSVCVHSLQAPLPQVNSVDGILLAGDFPAKTLGLLMEARLPAVGLIAQQDGVGIARVVGDNVAIGRLAGVHFRQRGFRNFAYVGPSDTLWSQLRMQGFSANIGRAKAQLIPADPNPNLADLDWNRERTRLGTLLGQLPKPCALFCASDPLACRVLDVCLEASLKVPEEMAILGVDDDPLYCESVAVPLSSVRHDVESIGFRAAERLQQIMCGHAVPMEEMIGPLGVTARQSTQHCATEEPSVLAALQFIEQNHCHPISVADVAQAAHRSKRSLQSVFKKELGHSVVERLIQTRIAKACDLLLNTSVSATDIAARTGFTSSGYFHRLFKLRVGMTPLVYRQNAQ